MKHFFLVDFENVSDAGLEGFFDLTAEDTVYLFYSPKANRISIDFFKALLEQRNAAAIHFVKVATGNQALDLQLASFLGHLISENPSGCSFCIISKDKGFSCLPLFWAGRGGPIDLRQAWSIAEASSRMRSDALRQAARQAAASKPAPVSEKTEPELEKSADTPAAPAEQPSETPAEAPAEAPEQPSEAPAEEAPAPAAVSEKPAEEKPEKPVEALVVVPEKPAEKPPRPAKPAAAKTPPVLSGKNDLNNKVQMVLSKAKYDTKIISHVASLISKTYGDKKIKQIVYRDLLKTYGQKQGLEIYNLVKPLLERDN